MAMKVLRTFSGQEFIIANEEQENILQIKNSGKKAFIELRCGSFVDSAAIESISDIPLVAFSGGGYRLSKDGLWFMEN